MAEERSRADRCDVLVVGAGPTGLVLALWLAREGIAVRIIDKAREAGTTSRALVVHARTLELYRELGIAEKVVDAGLEFDAVNLWVKGKRAAHLRLGAMGRGLSPFPYVVIYPQDEHERLLIAELETAGVRVERERELVSVRESPDGVEATVRGAAGGPGVVTARYLAGADGTHSVVRGAIGAGFRGGTYERMFYVADVEASGPVMNGELHIALDSADFVAAFPLARAGHARFVGSVQPAALQGDRKLEWNDVSMHAISRMRIDVERVNWFSTYHVHHRVASHFRRGRVFLLGDAAHVHSPVGGQGMNTGIGDAVNLAWKLADVIRSGAPESLLDSYEPERIAFARRLVETTDRAFTLVTRNGALARAIRLHLLPTVLPPLVRLPAVKRLFFRTISQTAIEYRKSPISEGSAGAVHGGDRLPWVEHAMTDGADNHAPLSARAWQLHVYGAARPAARDLVRARGIELVEFPWNASMRAAGFERDAYYLIRPDGYVALASPASAVATLARYLDHELRGFTGRSGTGYLRLTL